MPIKTLKYIIHEVNGAINKNTIYKNYYLMYLFTILYKCKPQVYCLKYVC